MGQEMSSQLVGRDPHHRTCQILEGTSASSVGHDPNEIFCSTDCEDGLRNEFPIGGS